MAKILALLGVILSAVTHMHLSVNAGILTVSVSVPWFLLILAILFVLFTAFMIVRALREPRVAQQRYVPRSYAPPYVVHGRVL